MNTRKSQNDSNRVDVSVCFQVRDERGSSTVHSSDVPLGAKLNPLIPEDFDRFLANQPVCNVEVVNETIVEVTPRIGQVSQSVVTCSISAVESQHPKKRKCERRNLEVT